MLAVSLSVLKARVEEVEISCLVFLTPQSLAVESASFQSLWQHEKLCAIITAVWVGVLKAFYCWLLLHCCVVGMVKFVTFFK